MTRHVREESAEKKAADVAYALTVSEPAGRRHLELSGWTDVQAVIYDRSVEDEFRDRGDANATNPQGVRMNIDIKQTLHLLADGGKPWTCAHDYPMDSQVVVASVHKWNRHKADLYMILNSDLTYGCFVRGEQLHKAFRKPLITKGRPTPNRVIWVHACECEFFKILK